MTNSEFPGRPEQPPVAPLPQAPVETAPASVPASRRGLAITALVLGIVAVVFAFFPPLSILLGIIAVVFGIIALVKRQSKGLALTGLILGGVGVIVSVILLVVGLIFTATLIEQGQRGEGPLANSSLLPSVEPTDVDEDTSVDESTGALVALGTAIEGDGYTVVINSFTPNQTAEVLAADAENAEPTAGNSYAVVNYTITYTGTAEGTPFEVGVRYVTSAGTVIELEDSFGFGPAPQLPLEETLAPGQSVTGNIALEIPDNDQGALLVNAGLNHAGVGVAIF
ncbi:hypothetical protein M2390_002022 [Mycetocola sp. BIGb0189]|uniref:DUF4190 domain-containing protein n=1 Tax=Mycetocola sp. BIGb0189 TaxID=2940604 RepID=UPI002169CAFB|nr:DUF4190 domain-containing protein [Mycetocola sp. BIGb0189]MCS4276828.1 hypothetical protein [Mycetocola sp. BIGb0189]